MKNESMMKEEFKSKLLQAQSAEEVAGLLKNAGMDESKAGQIWNEISSHRTEKELSLDELAAVSGGADRDWLTDGCAASVEPDSWCGSNDSCHYWDVTYTHEPAEVICPNCGAYMYLNWVDYATRPSDDIYHYKCKNCGTEESY
ncbi:MAG: hypothetical protein E7576_09345 [Ruminococcaceae bacterium]|nr:hypothetical protein [Oscillospiraceae bacterium]